MFEKHLSVPWVTFELRLDAMEVSSIVGDLQIRYVATMSKAKHLEPSHDAIYQFLTLEESPDLVHSCQKVGLWWHFCRTPSLSLLQVFCIVVSHGRHRKGRSGDRCAEFTWAEQPSSRCLTVVVDCVD